MTKFSSKNVLKRLTVLGGVTLLLCSPLSAGAFPSAQSQNISISMNNITLEDVLVYLKNEYGYYILYNSNVARNVKGLSINFTDATLDQIMRAALSGTNLEYTLNDNTVVIRQGVQQQPEVETVRITGVIRTATGQNAAGITVTLKGTRIAVASDANGQFSMNVARTPGATVTLTFSGIGYNTQDVEVTENMSLNVVMREAAYQLEAARVVNTGVFKKAKESFVGDATTITKAELEANQTRGLLQTVAFMEPSLRITQNNAAGSNPNYLPEITIRGRTSFSTSSDLSDLKGETQSTVNQPLVVLDGFEITLERFMDMNIDEIEEITILKDASATALYGSRGANGVIVVTSALPTPGEMTVTYSGQLQMEIPDLKSYNLLNSEQKIAVEMLAGLYSDVDNYGTEQLLAILDAVERGVNTDWISMPTRTGYGMNHRLQLSGGERTLRFMGNLNYNNKVGVIKGSFRNVFNAGLNVIYEKNRLFISNNLQINRVNSEESAYGTFSYIANLNPYWEPKDANGDWITMWQHISSSGTVNNKIYDGTTTFFDKTQTTGITNNVSVRYQILDDLRATGTFGLSRTITGRDVFTPASYTTFYNSGTYSKDEKGSYEENRTTQDRWEAGVTVDYSKVIREKSSLNIGLNGQMRSTHRAATGGKAIGFYNDNLNQLGNAVQWDPNSSPSGNETDTRSVQVMATANYMYDTRYAVDVMYRADGNSSFGDQSRWQTHFSVGGTWIISREKFFNLDFVDMFRVKYSYGMSGAENHVSPEASLYVFQYDNEYLYGDFLGSYLGQYGNPNLGWQNTYQHNAGVEFSFFRNRLEINASYYNKYTTNATLPLTLTPSHGYATYTANYGELRNTGWEVGVNTTLFKNNDWNIVLWTRLASNTNKIEKLSEEMKELVQAEVESQASTGDLFYTYREGASTTALWVYNSIGIDPLSGKRLYVMENGMITPYTHLLTGDVKVLAGDTEPTVNGSFSTNIRYKGLNVIFNFTYRWGGVQLNQTILSKVENASWANNVDRRVYSDRWRQPGDHVLYKGLQQHSNTTYPNTQFIQKDNNLTLAGVNITYDFSPEWLRKNLGIKSMQLGCQLSELWYASPIRRERGTDYPFSINPNFSLRVVF